jgi:hypothetical protein
MSHKGAFNNYEGASINASSNAAPSVLPKIGGGGEIATLPPPLHLRSLGKKDQLMQRALILLNLYGRQAVRCKV